MVGVVLSAFFCNIEEAGVEGPMAASAFLLERQTLKEFPHPHRQHLLSNWETVISNTVHDGVCRKFLWGLGRNREHSFKGVVEKSYSWNLRGNPIPSQSYDYIDHSLYGLIFA